jgi:SAM-dependent methyltransferase
MRETVSIRLSRPEADEVRHLLESGPENRSVRVDGDLLVIAARPDQGDWEDFSLRFYDHDRDLMRSVSRKISVAMGPVQSYEAPRRRYRTYGRRRNPTPVRKRRRDFPFDHVYTIPDYWIHYAEAYGVGDNAGERVDSWQFKWDDGNHINKSPFWDRDQMLNEWGFSSADLAKAKKAHKGKSIDRMDDPGRYWMKVKPPKSAVKSATDRQAQHDEVIKKSMARRARKASAKKKKKRNPIRDKAKLARMIKGGYDTSAETSVNKKKLPAVFTTVGERIGWKKKTRNLDLGGGKFDNQTRWLKRRGVKNLVLDPGNRPQAHNLKILNEVDRRPVDTVTVSNVLNVIPDTSVRAGVVRTAYDALKPGGRVYITVYNAPTRGWRGKGTKRTWQAAKPLKSYLALVRRYFKGAEIKHSMIIATKGGRKKK